MRHVFHFNMAEHIFLVGSWYEYVVVIVDHVWKQWFSDQ